MHTTLHLNADQHTLNHEECPACEAARQAVTAPGPMAQEEFAAAAEQWLVSRKRLKPGTRNCYEQYLAPLRRFFGGMALDSIHIGNLSAYQKMRQSEIRGYRMKFHGLIPERFADSDGASRINHELALVARILKRAGLWEPLRRMYEPLPLPAEEAGMAMSEEEERHFFRVAQSRPRWMLALCCDLLSVNTTAGPSELRYLRLRNLKLEEDEGRGAIYVEEGTKNKKERVRRLALNRDARWALDWLVARYREKMAQAGIREDPCHFLLFHRAHVRGAKPDPTRPMGSWKRAHYNMRREAAKQFPRLLSFRRYDFRHTAATKLLEDASISYSTIEKMLGHRLGSKTKRKYDHVRDASLRIAAESLDSGLTRRGPQPESPAPEPLQLPAKKIS